MNKLSYTSFRGGVCVWGGGVGGGGREEEFLSKLFCQMEQTLSF